MKICKYYHNFKKCKTKSYIYLFAFLNSKLCNIYIDFHFNINIYYVSNIYRMVTYKILLFIKIMLIPKN
ncbi:hypothetical protein PFAG_00709 [Plasmodium falciparum Santa Lucia]|uniref:Uncharacterized protein n=5 Tax=Plasmodium falciparum TaxID=5833 RepID=W7KKZ4_PLAFO|nr:hypothetical protein PFFCH_05597 [Plasmodium falciparum FCH/4]ETW44776.1 hypothetical protein PFNF135_00831 [Plasmodium falciparum NF135/5.C10]EUR78641.1 hypothetical protein PFBG_00736 [Plasmodium falciparum 7G8]EUT91375.1 hypothetical protein PFAG_00709 [Plasmodium falciparum Santa Lucia]EWC90247.1 hypothetical protein PFNF54_01010 [Plasmodium falciparum NF54]